MLGFILVIGLARARVQILPHHLLFVVPHSGCSRKWFNYSRSILQPRWEGQDRNKQDMVNIRIKK